MTTSQHDPEPIQPQRGDLNPRCTCYSEGSNGSPSMFHPSHPWGPCTARMPTGEMCPCTAYARPGDSGDPRTIVD